MAPSISDTSYGTAVETSAIAVSDLTVTYGSRNVLAEFSVKISAGEAVAVTGHNGTGKSTLLRCCAGLLTPIAGRLTVLGRVPDDSPAFWRDTAALIEDTSWYPGMAVREHLDLLQRVHGTARREPEALLAALGLGDYHEAAPAELSSGQRQRLALAAVLTRPSRVLLLDEPEQRLDTDIRYTVASLLRDYVADGGAVLLASHDPAFVTAVGAREVRLSEDGVVA